MSLTTAEMSLTTADKLAMVEYLIEDVRYAREEDPECVPDAKAYLVLKAIAAELRARLDYAPSKTLQAIERRLTKAAESKTALGYANGAMVGLAQEVIGRWPVVKAGLELLQEKTECQN